MPREASWTLHLDNDLFAFSERDRDYTAGAAFTLGGEAARTHALSVSSALGWLDRRTGLSKRLGEAQPEVHALELGLLLFTPQDLAARSAVPDDRPYANLAYVASSQLTLDPRRDVAYQSSLTLGVLGLPFAEQLRRVVHRALGSAVLENDTTVSHTLRRQTEEIDTGGGARGFTWASIGVARRF